MNCECISALFEVWVHICLVCLYPNEYSSDPPKTRAPICHAMNISSDKIKFELNVESNSHLCHSRAHSELFKFHQIVKKKAQPDIFFLSNLSVRRLNVPVLFCDIFFWKYNEVGELVSSVSVNSIRAIPSRPLGVGGVYIQQTGIVRCLHSKSKQILTSKGTMWTCVWIHRINIRACISASNEPPCTTGSFDLWVYSTGR